MQEHVLHITFGKLRRHSALALISIGGCSSRCHRASALAIGLREGATTVLTAGSAITRVGTVKGLSRLQLAAAVGTGRTMRQASRVVVWRTGLTPLVHGRASQGVWVEAQSGATGAVAVAKQASLCLMPP
jgi:hypothetical protein